MPAAATLTVTAGRRRFTCLGPRLVRVEFSPSGVFEDRRTIVAYNPRRPVAFQSVEEHADGITLRTGGLSIVSTQNERDFFPANLRIDWTDRGRTQTWRWGDRDYRNLGGAVRSLDYYDRDCLLNGVHPAGTWSPDDFLHTDAELADTNRVYFQDGHLDWQREIVRQGLYPSLRLNAETVYNRYVNMAGDLTRFQPGLLSRNGYFLLNDSTGAVLDEDNFPIERNTPGTRDLYFFGYGSDYKAAFQDFRLLSGAIPLPPKNIFGITFSRWPTFADGEARAVVEHFQQETIPLSVLVLDFEWHVPDFSHWDWNPEKYPDPEGFLAWAHSQHLLVPVSVHPQTMASSDSHFEPFVQTSGTRYKVQRVADDPAIARWTMSGADRFVPLDLANRAEAEAVKTLCCEPILRQGVDYWWVDGVAASMNGADGQLLTSKVFYETTEDGNRRGMVQGRYGGLGSHRHGVFFTGDTESQWEVLQSQCEFNIRAGQSGMAYVSHDIGGFNHAEAPLLDPDLYVRWLQFGVFSPVIRFHSKPGAGSREPWDYGPRNMDTARRWLALRNSLMPYIYSAARDAYATGIPLVRGLYIEHPDDGACYRFDEYLFGDALLVAPVLTPSNHRTVYLPEGVWHEFESGKQVLGGKEINVFATLGQVPVFVKAGAIIVREDDPAQPVRPFVQDLLLDAYPGGQASTVLYEDDGRTRDYQRDGFALTRFGLRETEGGVVVTGHPTEGRSLGHDRHVKLQMVLPVAPTSVTVDGRPIAAEAWQYASDSRRLRVDLGIIPTDSTWEAVVRR